VKASMRPRFAVRPWPPLAEQGCTQR
jgi:hypothetical protein